MDLRDVYNIVVIGAMNPRIHHPAWYRQVGLIASEEADAAVHSTGTFVTPRFAQLEVNKLVIVCQEERWEIRTSERTQLERLHEITTKVFDEILPHTPVKIVGFNFVLARETEAPGDVGPLLAQCVLGMPLGFSGEAASGAEIILRRLFHDHTAIVTVKDVPENPGALLVANNFEYKMEKPGPFKLADELAGRFEADRLDAERQTAAILEAFNRLVRG